jgi:hypothetical protein
MELNLLGYMGHSKPLLFLSRSCVFCIRLAKNTKYDILMTHFTLFQYRLLQLVKVLIPHLSKRLWNIGGFNDRDSFISN